MQFSSELKKTLCDTGENKWELQKETVTAFSWWANWRIKGSRHSLLTCATLPKWSVPSQEDLGM
jgi:hypothetical protein